MPNSKRNGSAPALYGPYTNVRWLLPGEIGALIDSLFCPRTDVVAAGAELLSTQDALSLTPEERLVEETLTHLVKNGVGDTLAMLRESYGLTRPAAREVVRRARSILVEDQEIDLDMAFAELRARIEQFINACRVAGKLREVGDGIKMLMQLHGFTRDRDVGGLKDLEETLKRVSARKTIEHKEIHEQGSQDAPAVPDAGYRPRQGLVRTTPIEIPEEAKR